MISSVVKKMVVSATVLASFGVGSFAFAAEDWKGQPPSQEFTLGGLFGLGIVDSSGGASVLGSVAKKILNQGFVPDINNQVYVEAEVGPLFTSGTTVFFYSGHLRWDFQKDDLWTFYALGGLAGDVTGAKLGDHWELYPRVGVGALWNIGMNWSVRGEVSHELIAVGINWSI